jgi:hypothetical protein
MTYMYVLLVLEQTTICLNNSYKSLTNPYSNDQRLQYLHKICIKHIRWVWGYQKGNQNPYIEEEQTTKWPKEKVQKD